MGILDWFGRRKHEKLALELEERGDFRGASDAWSRCGQKGKASLALGRLAADTSDTPERLKILARAFELAPPGTEERRVALAARSELLLEHARNLTEELPAWLRVDLRRAAKECETEHDHSNARAIYELLGDREGLVRVLTESGAVEELENLLSAESSERDAAQRNTAARQTADLALESGDRRLALEQFRKLGDAVKIESIEGRRPRGGRLNVMVGGDRHALLFVGGGQEVILGRSEGQVRIDSASVSRKHLRIQRALGRYRLTDVGSRNQTRIRGVPLVSSIDVELPTELELAPGIQIRLEAGPFPDAVLLSTPGEKLVLVFDSLRVNEGWTLRLATDDWFELAFDVPAFMGGRVEVAQKATILAGDRFALARGDAPLLEVLP